MIETGTLKNYDAGTHTAGVQTAGSITTYLDAIPVSAALDSGDMTIGHSVILAIPGNNLKDAVVIAVYEP